MESSEQLQDDKLAMTLDALANNPDITDEMLAETLGLTRPASARFWRLKAQEMIKDREPVQAQQRADCQRVGVTITNMEGR